jgi:nucleoid-associated protein YgaU
MASRWIVKRGEKEGGPFTSPELRSLADSGQLRRTDLVTRQGSDRFVKAEEVKGLSFPPASEELEPGIVKIVEDEEPVIVIDAVDDSSEEPAILIDPVEEPVVGIDADNDPVDEPVFVIDSAEKPAIVDYDYDYDDDFEEPEPAPRRRSHSRSAVSPVRSSGSRRAAPALEKPARKRKPAKKKSADGDEEEDGPWANLWYGLACVIAGVLLFIAMTNEDPNTWETGRRGGFLVAIVKLIYNIGGRWTVLGLMLACSGLFFWSAANQFRNR